MQSRREFLTAASIAAGGLLLCSQTRFAAQAAEVVKPTEPPTEPLRKRAIPATGQEVPVIGAGTSGSYNVQIGSPEYEALKETIKVFFDGGGTVFDTSPNYGNADAALGALLEDGGYRDRCFLATKIAADSREAAEAQWAGSLKKLRTDHVELLQVHNLRDWKTQLAYARELKEQGATKYVGITHYLDGGLSEMEEIMRAEPLDFIQIHYSVNGPKAAETVLPLAKEKGIAVLINRAFDDGRLFAEVKGKPLPGWAAEVEATSWAQLFLKFAISNPAVTAVIPATSKPKHQADNLHAGVGPLLSEKQQKELIETFA
ncbi:General stress protein 69 [Methyloligella halotolerans]|uniref:General stress protein 69 n=1 Tax=Methyloligella halotolerans TaxID=1177755 RepID=A0A1E2RWM0_9HYPH|nr:aldo/keto reductase [Methyloligella halotolerans]ODA66488.1 General stress protein 69 [Methyloligella halotolerans]